MSNVDNVEMIVLLIVVAQSCFTKFGVGFHIEHSYTHQIKFLNRPEVYFPSHMWFTSAIYARSGRMKCVHSSRNLVERRRKVASGKNQRRKFYKIVRKTYGLLLAGERAFLTNCNYFRQGVMLSHYLFVSKIMQKPLNRFSQYSVEMWHMDHEETIRFR